MSLIRKIFIILLFFFLINSFAYCLDDNKKAVEIVDSYLRKQLIVGISNYYTVQDYFHPDLAFPPGEIERLHVVSLKYKIVKIQRKRMNIDIMEPKNEDIIIVTVLFDRYCDIYNNKFVTADKNYTRNYFLSKSTGKWLILDFDDPPEKTASLEAVTYWVSEMKEKSKKWHELYTKLIALQEQQQEDK